MSKMPAVNLLYPIPVESISYKQKRLGPKYGYRSAILCMALVIIFLIAGTFGREPWKADEPYSFGMVLNFIQGEFGWVIPHVGADPFVEKSPLMYWSAALSAYLTQRWIPLFQGAQLAVLAWVSMSLFVLWKTAASLDKLFSGAEACLLFLSAVGVIVPIHMLTADVSQLTGATLIVSSLLLTEHSSIKPRLVGFIMGTGAGIAFLSKGILLLGVLALIGLFGCCMPKFRTIRFAMIAVWAGISVLPWLLIWPVLFWMHSPTLFLEWFWNNNFGRFFGFVHLGGHRPSYTRYGIELLSLIFLTFPCSWIAVSAAITSIKNRQLPKHILVWLYVGLLTFTLLLSSSFRTIYLLPLFPALALLAVGSQIPYWASRMLAYTALAISGIVGVAIWGSWLCLVINPQILPNSIGRWLFLGSPLPINKTAFFIALLLSVIWASCYQWRNKLGSLLIWFASVSVLWGLIHTLLLPWIEIGRSYKQVFSALSHALPAQANCLATYQVGESERAMLHYYLHIRPYQVKETDQALGCPFLLIQGQPALKEMRVQNHWYLVWQGHRYRHNREPFELWQH